MAAELEDDELQEEALKKLFPEQYYARFISEGIRPDGRPLARCRATTIGINAVSTADSSALVKKGRTTAISGIKLEVMVPSVTTPAEGRVCVSVDLPPLCSADSRPGRPSPVASTLTDQLVSALSRALDYEALCIEPGRAAWVVYLDVSVLDADGSLYDAVLLAATACLANLQLPRVQVDEHSNVVPAEAADGASAAPQQQQQPQQLMKAAPLALTSAFYDGKFIADPTAQEEQLLSAVMTVTTDAAGTIGLELGPGGNKLLPALSTAQQIDCIEAAKLHYKELSGLLQQAMQAPAQQKVG